ncbi:MAG: polysaccharide deacetylase family protein [bacterium]|nr:polysaccharide deacetylase family protein [bacterium]
MFIVENAFSDFYADIKTTESVVFLTLDDGPSKYTEMILDILKKHNVKAVFFVEGIRIKNLKHVLKRILNEGHTIGNHTMNHLNFYKLEKKLDMEKLTAKFIEEIKLCEEEVFNTTGYKTKLLRMPHGYARKWVIQTAQKMGYVVVNWSFGYDWHGFKKEELLKKYTTSLKKGSIILMHDTIKTTAEFLEEFILQTKKLGFRFAKLEDFIRR